MWGAVRVDVYYVVIECPNTGRALRTGLELSELGAFDFVGLMPESLPCQHCSQTHVWTKRDAWVERRTASRIRVRPAIADLSKG